MKPKAGDRIRLLHMDDDWDPIPDGATGTVQTVTDLALLGGGTQLHVTWDPPHEGRSLSIVSPPDTYEILP